MIAFPQIGFFDNSRELVDMEGCSIADMTALEVKLTQLGMGDAIQPVERLRCDPGAREQVQKQSVTARFRLPSRDAQTFARRVGDLANAQRIAVAHQETLCSLRPFEDDHVRRWK